MVVHISVAGGQASWSGAVGFCYSYGVSSSFYSSAILHTLSSQGGGGALYQTQGLSTTHQTIFTLFPMPLLRHTAILMGLVTLGDCQASLSSEKQTKWYVPTFWLAVQLEYPTSAVLQLQHPQLEKDESSLTGPAAQFCSCQGRMCTRTHAQQCSGARERKRDTAYYMHNNLYVGRRLSTHLIREVHFGGCSDLHIDKFIHNIHPLTQTTCLIEH